MQARHRYLKALMSAAGAVVLSVPSHGQHPHDANLTENHGATHHEGHHHGHHHAAHHHHGHKHHTGHHHGHKHRNVTRLIQSDAHLSPETKELLLPFIHRGSKAEAEAFFSSETFHHLDFDHQRALIEELSEFAHHYKLRGFARAISDAMTEIVEDEHMAALGHGVETPAEDESEHQDSEQD